MMRLSKQKIDQIHSLRSEGKSINEIRILLEIPKTTVWHHVRNITLTAELDQILKSKRGANSDRYNKRLNEAKKIAASLLDGKQREDVVGATMLYWAEGSKKSPEFINSDGAMIKFYLKFIRIILKVPEDQIKGTVRYFTGMSEQKCLDYWQKITTIPVHRLKVRYNDGGKSGRTAFGLCRITICKGGQQYLKIFRSLIELVIKDKKLIDTPS